MPLINGQITDYLHCIICLRPFSGQRKPFTLLCSHTCCLSCLETIQNCPYDHTTINRNIPENQAILGLIESGSSRSSLSNASPNGNNSSYNSAQSDDNLDVSKEDRPHYQRCVDSIKQITSLLKPQQSPLSRPMQRKLISLLHCQFVEGEGRSRAMRNARSIGERALSELLIKHQDPHTLSANLWAAVRTRGCQFLGPAMQEDVLRLVLLALDGRDALSRKVLVMYVVQRLSPHFPHQASKTAIGHVIQLLYRASCFKLTKREGDSSLMQLKEEYCSYEALRREHDTQIVSIALEAGLRISPDQWSSLLYGDTEHKSHMQSIIDKLQSPQSFQQSIQELVIALQRTGDPASLASLKEHFDKLAQIDPGLNTESATHPSFLELADTLESTKIVATRLVEFLRDNANGTYKTSHRIQSYFTSLNKNRVHRVKSHPTTCYTAAPSSPITSPIEKTFSYHNLSDHLAKLIDPRATITKPIKPLNNSRYFNLQNQGSLSLPVPPHRMSMVSPVAPKAKHNSYMPTSHTRYPSRDSVQSKSLALASIPTIVVDSTTSHQSSPTASPVVSYCDLTNERLTAISPVSFGNSNSSQSSLTCPLPSDEDQFIPFDEQPFVSKYGPISRAMNLINTPTMAGSSSNSRCTSNNLLGNISTSTQPTSVIFGNRTALPPLTYSIQPYQNLVLHTFMADGHKKNFNRNQTLNDNSYSITSPFSPAVSLT